MYSISFETWLSWVFMFNFRGVAECLNPPTSKIPSSNFDKNEITGVFFRLPKKDTQDPLVRRLTVECIQLMGYLEQKNQRTNKRCRFW